MIETQTEGRFENNNISVFKCDLFVLIYLPHHLALQIVLTKEKNIPTKSLSKSNKKPQSTSGFGNDYFQTVTVSTKTDQTVSSPSQINLASMISKPFRRRRRTKGAFTRPRKCGIFALG